MVQTPMIESAAKESASAEKTPIGGASREPLLPGNPREPGLRESAVRAAFDADYRSGERKLHCVVSSDFEKNAHQRARCPKITAEVEAISWRLRECIRMRELAATHRLGQCVVCGCSRSRRPGSRTETIPKRREQHFLAGFHSESFHAKLYNPKSPYTPEEHTLEMSVDVERLRMEIVFSKPATSVRSQMNPKYRELRVSQRRGK